MLNAFGQNNMHPSIVRLRNILSRFHNRTENGNVQNGQFEWFIFFSVSEVFLCFKKFLAFKKLNEQYI